MHVGELASRFGVSEATLRRDLALLEEQRLLTRTHGGALAQDSVYELPTRFRDTDRKDAKRAIAKLAAQRLPAGPHVVALTGGTTTSEVSRQLAGRHDRTLVTNALNIADGGGDAPPDEARGRAAAFAAAAPTSWAAPGPRTSSAPSTSAPRSSAGTAQRGGGLTTHDEQQARTDRALIERAQRVDRGRRRLRRWGTARSSASPAWTSSTSSSPTARHPTPGAGRAARRGRRDRPGRPAALRGSRLTGRRQDDAATVSGPDGVVPRSMSGSR